MLCTVMLKFRWGESYPEQVPDILIVSILSQAGFMTRSNVQNLKLDKFRL